MTDKEGKIFLMEIVLQTGTNTGNWYVSSHIAFPEPISWHSLEQVNLLILRSALFKDHKPLEAVHVAEAEILSHGRVREVMDPSNCSSFVFIPCNANTAVWRIKLISHGYM
ncbi:hypothetical protein J6590_030081 [Homalodisca vitripennis]|nr:hypothetical protein J6590_030081 [Homalodisca vitripennis]